MKSTISQEQISNTAVRLGIPDVPFTHRRIARAFDLFETNKVNEVSREDGIYRVHSQYNDAIYTVEVNHGRPHCTCPDGKKTVFCKHMIASMMTAFEQEQEPKLTRNFDYDAEVESHGEAEASPVCSIAQRMAPRRRIAVKETPMRALAFGIAVRQRASPKVKASWVVIENGQTYVNVWQDLNGKICCVCGAYYKKDCIHKQAIRDFYDGGNGSKRIENYCGSVEAKAIQDKLNGNNGTGDTKSPSHQLDTSDPFQESEQLDIDQIEGRSWRVRSHALGDLVHALSNGEYVISYRGIMKLAEQHGVTFEASRHDETRTVIAYGRCGNNTRISGKPLNGSEMTALELAKRNTARQLLPYAEIKALEYKAKLEADFDWQKAKTACLEIVPDFTLDILINDMVRDGTLRQAHPSDYNRKEWRLIFDACKRDAETNGHDGDGGGDNTPSSDDEKVTCCICNRTLTNKLSISRCVGPECYKKVGAQGAQFLRDDEVSDELIKASKLYQDEVLQKRILRACLTLDAPAPVKVLNWLGNEYFGYRNRPILYYFCASGQLNRIDTSNRKLRHVIVTRDTAETELDAHALAQWSTQAKPRSACDRTRQRRVSPAVDGAEPSELNAGIPKHADEFIAKCKQAEAEVEDTTADDDTPTNGDGKRKLQMSKDKIIWLIEADGTRKRISYPEAGKLTDAFGLQ